MELELMRAPLIGALEALPAEAAVLAEDGAAEIPADADRRVDGGRDVVALDARRLPAAELALEAGPDGAALTKDDRAIGAFKARPRDELLKGFPAVDTQRNLPTCDVRSEWNFVVFRAQHGLDSHVLGILGVADFIQPFDVIILLLYVKAKTRHL